MKSLYGTIINHSPRSIFDISKTYPNVFSMFADQGKGGADVPPNGYILIDYTQNSENAEDKQGVYNTNFGIDNREIAPDGITVDYHQTVWQKRYSVGDVYDYYAIARLHSVLPLLNTTELKGTNNNVVFQRNNAFPLQGEITELRYKDFGTRRDLFQVNVDGSYTHYEFKEAINFDENAMKVFNTAYPSVDFTKADENKFTLTTFNIDELNSSLADYFCTFEDSLIFPNFYTAYQNINEETIPENGYIIIDYTKKIDEDFEYEATMDKYTQEYENIILNEDSIEFKQYRQRRYNRSQEIDTQQYGLAGTECNLNYHGIIFQKQLINAQFKFIPVDINRLQLNPTTASSDVLPAYSDIGNVNSDKVRTVTYNISSVNSKQFQKDIESEMLRAEASSLIAQHNLNQIQEFIEDKTSKILKNSADLSANMNSIIEENTNIQTNIGLIEKYESDVSKALSTINNSTNNITDYVENIDDAINSIKNTECANITNKINNISTQKSNISNNITEVRNNISSIKTNLNDIKTNHTNLSTTLTETINAVNTKLDEYQTCLVEANSHINTAISQATTASNNLDTYASSLSSATTSISTATSNITSAVNSINSATNINNVKNYTSTISTNVSTISTQVTNLNAINLSSIVSGALSSIKNLSTVADPTHVDQVVPSTLLENIESERAAILNIITNNIESCLTNIENYCTNITNDITSINNSLTSLNTKLSEISTTNNQINDNNTIIIKQTKVLESELIKLQSYRAAIQNSKNEIEKYNNENIRLNNDNINLTNEINRSMLVYEDQLNIFNVTNNEYILYINMWQWYQNIFLPYIFNLTIDTKNLNIMPATVDLYNTLTIEYPTK